jgi:Fe2+ transport system protein FeoA
VIDLGRVLPGRAVRVIEMPDSARQALEQEGVAIGAEVTVEKRIGMGGPVIVRFGRTRLAIARAVASGIQTEPVSERGAAAQSGTSSPEARP